MDHNMKRTGWQAAALVAGLLLVAGQAAAQGRGGGSCNGCGAGRGGGQGNGGYGQSQGGYGQGAGDQIRQRDRDRIHVDGEQGSRLRDCTGSGQRSREHARGIRANAGNAAAAAQERDRVRDQTHSMFEQHDRFMAGLGPGEREALGAQIGRLDRTRSRIEDHLRRMDQELAREQPDATEIGRLGRDLERELRRWQNQHRNFTDNFAVGS